MGDDFKVEPIQRAYRANNDLRQRYKEQPKKDNKDKKQSKEVKDTVKFTEVLMKKIEESER